LAVALAECCVAGGIGARVRLPEGVHPFAEAPGCAYLVSGPADAVAALGPVIGRVDGARLEIVGVLDLAVSELRRARELGLAEWV
jgi:hypothetical protein